MTDNQKLFIIKDLERVIETNKDKEPKVVKKFVLDLLEEVVEECNESWCDSCGIKKATGMLCNEYLDLN